MIQPAPRPPLPTPLILKRVFCLGTGTECLHCCQSGAQAPSSAPQGLPLSRCWGPTCAPCKPAPAAFSLYLEHAQLSVPQAFAYTVLSAASLMWLVLHLLQVSAQRSSHQTFPAPLSQGTLCLWVTDLIVLNRSLHVPSQIQNGLIYKRSCLLIIFVVPVTT